MKALKTILIVLACVIVLLFAVFLIYWLVNKQGVIEPFDVGSPDLTHKVLIASQGSDFKDALVESLITYLEKKQVYIKVVDVTTLAGVDEDEWDAVVLIHTTEQWKLQPDVKAYLDRTQDLSKVVVLTTSGSGDWKTEDYDIDVLTSASKSEELPALVNEMLSRLDLLLKR